MSMEKKWFLCCLHCMIIFCNGFLSLCLCGLLVLLRLPDICLFEFVFFSWFACCNNVIIKCTLEATLSTRVGNNGAAKWELRNQIKQKHCYQILNMPFFSLFLSLVLVIILRFSHVWYMFSCIEFLLNS